MAKILIVDDSELNRKLLADILRKRDEYVCTEADCGETALMRVEQDPPDVILLDVMMPGISGFEVCEKLKSDERFSAIPIIFVTAMGDAQSLSKGFQLGGSDYIAKPVNGFEVMARVSSQIQIREAEKERLEIEGLKTIKDMVATYNHNMNQPLMAAFMFIEGFKGRFDEGDRAHERLVKIKNELSKVKEILEKIQDIDKLERTQYVGDSAIIDLNSGQGLEGPRST